MFHPCSDLPTIISELILNVEDTDNVFGLVYAWEIVLSCQTKSFFFEILNNISI